MKINKPLSIVSGIFFLIISAIGLFFTDVDRFAIGMWFTLGIVLIALGGLE